MSSSQGYANPEDNPPALPPYKCARTPDDYACLKFYWNSEQQRYNRPSGGERVRCDECAYFFES
jgi:hypothetical protein